jgi:uncharacterized protein YkuJ
MKNPPSKQTAASAEKITMNFRDDTGTMAKVAITHHSSVFEVRDKLKF